MKILVIKIIYRCTLTASCYVWSELAKKKHSKSTCFVSYVIIHNRPQSTTRELRSSIPAMPTFQLMITVILCPSNTVKSFCNAWHLLYFTFYLHLKFHWRCFASYLFRWEAMKGWWLDSCCLSVTHPFTFRLA